MTQRAIDLHGMRFGKLTVIQRDYRIKKNDAYWICNCDCGKTTSARANHLRSGNVNSCSRECRVRKRLIDISGRRNHRLTAVKRLEGNGKTYEETFLWACVCDCGKEITLTLDDFQRGDTYSCGCTQNPSFLTPKTAAENQLLASARYRAVHSGIPFSITLNDIAIPKYCPLLGLLLKTTKGRLSNNSPTLDKIIPSKGYVKGNVWVISHKANRMKSDMSIFDMRNFADIIEDKIFQLSPQETQTQ